MESSGFRAPLQRRAPSDGAWSPPFAWQSSSSLLLTPSPTSIRMTSRDESAAALVLLVMRFGNARARPPPLGARDQLRRFSRLCACAGCKAPDCGKCVNCLDKPRFGGAGVRKKSCVRRVCRLAQPLVTLARQTNVRRWPRPLLVPCASYSAGGVAVAAASDGPPDCAANAP